MDRGAGGAVSVERRRPPRTPALFRTSGAVRLAPGMVGYDPSSSGDLLTTTDVQALLQRAAAAVNRNDAIIAVVDRNGNILGVRVESGVSPQITANTTNRVFAIDGAVSLARTGAYFGNNQAPLTSRTIQEISQTTITQARGRVQPERSRSQRQFDALRAGVRRAGRNQGAFPAGHHVHAPGRPVQHRSDQSR